MIWTSERRAANYFARKPRILHFVNLLSGLPVGSFHTLRIASVLIVAVVVPGRCRIRCQQERIVRLWF
jgi:hypothetical protein